MAVVYAEATSGRRSGGWCYCVSIIHLTASVKISLVVFEQSLCRTSVIAALDQLSLPARFFQGGGDTLPRQVVRNWHVRFPSSRSRCDRSHRSSPPTKKTKSEPRSANAVWHSLKRVRFDPGARKSKREHRPSRPDFVTAPLIR